MEFRADKSFSSKAFNKLLNRLLKISLIGLSAATLFFFFFDIPVAKLCYENLNSPLLYGTVVKTFRLIGKVGRDHYCLFFWLALYALLPLKNKFSKDKGLFLFFSYIIPFFAVYLLKFILGRARPLLYFEEGLYGFTFFEIVDGSKFSMPSGHACIISATMTSLALIYPKFAYFFYTVSFLVSLSRVITGAHYPSDIIIGWTLGYIIVQALYNFKFKFAFEGVSNLTPKGKSTSAS